uniref:hypothetical protein n=1 Tax=Nonomuraea bangladeshensis TaxID=404385 RepID=UPI003F49AB11
MTNPAPMAPGAAVAHPLISHPSTTCRQGDTLLARLRLALSHPALVTDPVPCAVTWSGRRQLPWDLTHETSRCPMVTGRSGAPDRPLLRPRHPATLRLFYDREDTDLPPSFRFGRAMRSLEQARARLHLPAGADAWSSRCSISGTPPS